MRRITASRWMIAALATATAAALLVSDQPGLRAQATAPGGVAANLKLWLKAEAGVTGTSPVTSWNDQSGNGSNTTTQIGSAAQTLVSNGMNFNPVVRFTGAGGLNGVLSPALTSNNVSAFVVVKPLTTGSGGFARVFGVHPTGQGDCCTADRSVLFHRFPFGTTTMTTHRAGYKSSVANAFDKPGVFSTHYTTGGQNVMIYNGTASTPVASVATAFNSDRFEIATGLGGEFLAGDIAEVILYTADQTAAGMNQRINSYLALKHGITLSHSYFDSAGATIWDRSVNTPHNNNITGIGRDDASGLVQRQSQSVNTANSGDLVTIGLSTIAVDNASHPGSFAADRNFLMWGDDGASDAFATPIATPSAQPAFRMTRTWRVEETGTVATAKVSVPATIAPDSLLYLVVSNDSAFDNTDQWLLMTPFTAGAANYRTADFDFTTGQYFTFAMRPQANLAITKSNGGTTYTPGANVTYTIVVSNSGPSAVTGAQIDDALPSGITDATWSCVGGTGGTCTSPSGTGAITNALVNLPVGGTATFTLTMAIPSARFGSLTNTATVTAPAETVDPDTSNNSATDVDTVQVRADLRVTKTDNRSTYTPGSAVTYTIVVSNAGPSDVAGIRFRDPMPANITTASWTCAGTNGASCNTSAGPITSGSGSIGVFPNASIFLTLPANSWVTILYTVEVPSTFSGNLVNTASIFQASPSIDPDQTDNTATDTDTVAPADLTITKVSTPNPYEAGSPFSYTVVASNAGPGNAPGATIADTLPAALAGFTWTCTGSGGATCDTASGSAPDVSTLADLPAGSSVTIVASGTLPSGTVGPLSNEATIAPPSNVPDPVMDNNTATDLNPLSATADLRVSKTSTPNPFVPGETLIYTVVATNAGPSDAPGARVHDALPAEFAAFTWTCTPGAGAACGTASGTGDIDALVDLPAGTAATFTISGIVPSSYTGTATNTVTIAPPTGVTDRVLGNNTAATQNPPTIVADLAITKAQLPDPYVPGTGVSYTLLVQNHGPSDVANVRVQDMLPGSLSNVSWTCAASGAGAWCGTPTGMSVVDALVTLPVGTITTFTITGDVPAGQVGALINTATVAAPLDVTDPVPGNNTATVTSGPAPEADLSIVKTAAPDPYVPGAALTFTMVVSNAGPSDAPNARVQDLFPTQLSGFTWTCAPSAGAATCGLATGTGLIDVLVGLPAGAAVTFTATGMTPADTTEPLTNTATVVPPVAIRDPDLTNNLSAVTPGSGPQADLRLTKTSTPNPYVAGMPIAYTVTATNEGPSDLVGGRVQDVVPPVLQNVTWTCSASNGTCPALSGSGSIDALIDLGVGGTVTFTIAADVPASVRGPLINTATVQPPAGLIDPTPANNAGVDANPAPVAGGLADLQIVQEFPAVAPPNGLLTFRLVTKNLGSRPALNPYVTGMIPPGTTFVSATASAGGLVSPPGNPPAPDPATGYPIAGAAAVAPLQVTWPGLMRPGETHTLEFTVRVAPTTPTGQILWSCWWTWSEMEDPHHANNVVDAYLFVHDGNTPVGDLALQGATVTEGVVGNERPVRVGEAVPIRFWATNHGPATTRGQYALILDTANAVDVVNVEVPQGWMSPSGPGSAVWDTGPVAPGQTVTLELTVRLQSSGAVKLFAQRVSGIPGDPNATNEHAEIVLDGYGPAGTAGRWVAVGNVDGAGAGEIVTGAGQGETPQVRVYSGAGADTGVRFFAYERPFRGGVQIASCDVNGDGVAELITAPGPGRATTIRVLSLVGGVVTELLTFDAFEDGFTGGASIACADLDADGSAELIVGAGPGRAPEVQVYHVGPGTLTQRATFLAYEDGFRGGVRVAAGAYPGRPGWLGAFAIATTPGPGRPVDLRLWEAAGAPVAQVGISSATNGVLPTLGDANGDGRLDLVVAPDDGRPELVRIFDVDTGDVIGAVPGGSMAFPVGVRIALGVLTGGPGVSEIVVGNGPGGHPRVRVVFWPPAGPVQRLDILPLEIP